MAKLSGQSLRGEVAGSGAARIRAAVLACGWALVSAAGQAQTLNLPATLNSGAYAAASTVTNCTGTVSQANCTSVTLAADANVTMAAAAQIVLGPGFTAVAGDTSTSLIASIVPAPSLSAVTISPASVTSGGSATITVTLNSNAIYGAVAVALSSSNAAAFSPPASITVAAGQISGSATMTAGTVSASTPVTVTGSYNGLSQQESVTILPPPIVLTSLTVNPSTVISTNSATVTVTLSGAAPSGGAVVTLSSNNTAAFNPPASITVAAGQTSALVTVYSGTVSASTSATVTGSYGGTQTGSVTILPLPTVTNLSISPASVTSGGSAQITVTLSSNAPSGGAVVTLSSNNMSAFNPPASITVGAGQVAGYVTVVAGAVTSPASVVVTGSYNGSSQPGPITVAPPPDFTITLTPSSNPATAMVGGSAIFTVAVSPANGFSGTVTLTALGLPTGASATFSPATITGSGTSTMTVTAPASGTGNFTVTANGSSGSLSHNAVSSLAVQDFTVTLSPYNANNPPTVAQGGSQTFTISTAGINGFTGNIGLNYVVGSPQCQLSNLNVPPPAAAGSAAAMTLYLTPYFTGPCYFQVSATANGDTHLLNAWLDVISSASFGLTLPPSQGALTATPTAQPTVVFTPTLTIVNNFCGTIDFQVSGLPVGATASAPPVYLCANSPQTAQITVTVAPGTPQGTSPLTINAYGANGNVGQDVNQYLNPILQVGSGGSTFSISASAPQTTAPGGTAQYTITVNGSAGLGNVTLTASGGPPGATVQLGSASVAVGGQTTLTVVAPLNEGLGAYPVSITGMLGTVPKYATALTNVAQAAPASIISPTPGALPAGQNTFTFTWNSGIGATQYQLAVSSSPSGANCSSAAAAQSSTVTLVSDASPLYATLSSLTPAGCLAQSYVYYVPSVSLGTLISWGSIVIRPGAPPVTVSSPVSGDTITGCSVPSAGVTAVIAGAAGSQTVTFTASATASQGTTTIACSTAGLSTLLMNAQYVTDADGISDIQRMQTGPGLYHISIFGFGFGDNEDGGANVYVGGAATLNGFTWTDNDVEIDMTVPDGVCGTYAIVLDPDGSDFDDPDDFGDFAPAPLETSVESCPDVPAPMYTISGQVTLNTTGQGLPGVTINLTYPDGSYAFSQITGPDGGYSYTVTQTGYYQVTPSFTGPTLYWVGNYPVLILVNASVTVNFPANPKTTVFLVHGIGQSYLDMQPLASNLTAVNGLDQTKFFVDAGFDYSRCAAGGSSCNLANGIPVPVTSPAFCSVANGGQSLATYIRTWTPPGFPNPTGPPGSIVLIGYSMGGLMTRDMIAKQELAGGPPIAGLITLDTPNLGYPFIVADTEVFCPQLVVDMAGSWLTGTSTPVTPSAFLSALATNWPTATYGSYWMAAAGQACNVPNLTGLTGARVLDPAIGCPASNLNSDCVVCANSSAYQGTNSSQAPGPAPSTPGTTPWVDSSFLYVHTTTLGGWGTITVLGANPPLAIPIYNPQPTDTLFQKIMAVINGY